MKPDKTWTLFLDRDGVINERTPNDYIKKWDDFSFVTGSLKAMERLSVIFGRIVIVTNQAGVGKGLMTEKDLKEVHRLMLKTIDLLDGRVDKIYAATNHPDIDTDKMRKPHSGMGHAAKKDFPEIDFEKSVIVGDSISDMLFGKNLGMKTVFVHGKGEDASSIQPDYVVNSLKEFAELIDK